MEKNLRKKKTGATPAGSNRSTPASSTSTLSMSVDNSRASSRKSVTSASKSFSKSQTDFENGLDIVNPEAITVYL